MWRDRERYVHDTISLNLLYSLSSSSFFHCFQVAISTDAGSGSDYRHFSDCIKKKDLNGAVHFLDRFFAQWPDHVSVNTSVVESILDQHPHDENAHAFWESVIDHKGDICTVLPTEHGSSDGSGCVSVTVTCEDEVESQTYSENPDNLFYLPLFKNAIISYNRPRREDDGDEDVTGRVVQIRGWKRGKYVVHRKTIEEKSVTEGHSEEEAWKILCNRLRAGIAYSGVLYIFSYDNDQKIKYNLTFMNQDGTKIQAKPDNNDQSKILILEIDENRKVKVSQQDLEMDQKEHEYPEYSLEQFFYVTTQLI